MTDRDPSTDAGDATEPLRRPLHLALLRHLIEQGRVLPADVDAVLTVEGDRLLDELEVETPGGEQPEWMAQGRRRFLDLLTGDDAGAREAWLDRLETSHAAGRAAVTVLRAMSEEARAVDEDDADEEQRGLESLELLGSVVQALALEASHGRLSHGSARALLERLWGRPGVEFYERLWRSFGQVLRPQ